MSNGREPCIICRKEALCIAFSGVPDKHEYRCDNCGNYIFNNGLNRVDYDKLPEDDDDIAKFSKYIKEFNEATGKRAELGDITILRRQIEDFNRINQQEK